VNGIQAAILKDLLRYARDPAAIAMWLGIPLLVGGLLVTVMGGLQGPAPTVQLLIADEDDSHGSRLLLGILDQQRNETPLRTERVDAADGRQRLDQGEASALLIIPPGFVEAVLREEPTKLELVTNPSQRIGPGMIQELLQLLQEAVFYAHRLVGPEIREMIDGPPEGEDSFSNATIARWSISFHERVRRLDRYLSPPVVELQTPAPEKEEPEEAAAPSIPFSFYFLPGMLLMGLLFAAQGLTDDVWKERESGTLRRIVSTPLGITRFMIGKIAACSVVLALLASIVLAAGFWYFEIPWQRFPLALLWSVGSGVMLTGIMLPVQLFASSHRGASVLSFLVVFPLMMLGGSMFPLEAMPSWLAAIGKFTPNGWAGLQLKAILLGQQGSLALPAAFLLLLLVSLALFAIAGVRMVRVFARS
jgi:ABC-type multidrug transport system permease subunit